MELRETKSSEYTQRDTPIFTCIQMPLEAVLDQLF
jgi:chlorite dismutase